MKKLLLYSLCVIIIVVGVFVSIQILLPLFQKSSIYIAVAGPMSGHRKKAGRAILNGVKLFAEKVNREGGVDGREVKLLVFDDKAQGKVALDVASKIVEDKRIHLVLGHFTSGSTIAAGRLYRKNGIPAVTASATAGPVTAENDWYFRTIASNSFQGAFIAAYASTFLNKTTASIIFDKDSYGQTLSKDFEDAANETGIKVLKKWGFEGDSKNLEEEFKRIASELRAIDDPGLIFLATHGTEGAKIITILKNSGTNYDIFGPDAFTTKSFLRQFEKYPLEKAKPGYYSNGIYAVSPLVLEIGDESAYKFKKQFIEKYKEVPTWPAATYYDAMGVVMEALNKADIQGEGHSRHDRKEIRESLASIHSPEYAYAGLNGLIYFDKIGDCNAPMAVGRYKRKLFLPSFTQYTLRPGTAKETDDILSNVLQGKMIVVKDRTLNITRVAYTGIDVNEISNLNIKNGTCTMDFYVWFRFMGDFPASDIVFPNAVKPVEMNEPIVDEMTDGVTIKTYHVKADFKNILNFGNFPFDKHTLYLKFRHREMQCGELVYVKDVLGMPRPAGEDKVGKIELPASLGWEIRDRNYFQDVETNVSTFGMPKYFDNETKIAYSQFNAAISIARKGYGVCLRNLIPFLLLLLAIYSVYHVDYTKTALRAIIGMGSLFTTAVYHVYHLVDLPVEQNTVLEYFIFTLYFLIAFSGGVSMWILRMEKRGTVRYVPMLNRTAKIFHFAVAVAVVGVTAWKLYN